MDPSAQFCPNFYCLHRGVRGLGNIRSHSRCEQRYRCTTCSKTFAATRNTPYYRLHKPIALATTVLTLLSHGCGEHKFSPRPWTAPHDHGCLGCYHHSYPQLTNALPVW